MENTPMNEAGNKVDRVNSPLPDPENAGPGNKSSGGKENKERDEDPEDPNETPIPGPDSTNVNQTFLLDEEEPEESDLEDEENWVKDEFETDDLPLDDDILLNEDGGLMEDDDEDSDFDSE